MKRILLFLCFLPLVAHAQPSVERVEPPFWWTDMHNPDLQIMVYGQEMGSLHPEIEYPGVRLKRTITVENPNYLFLDLEIGAETAPGALRIQFRNAENQVVRSLDYELRAREAGSAQRKGYDNADVMYLITPDRFANGDPDNDNVEGMPDPMSRSDKWGRHGGDIRGIINHLDYLADIGYTAIWLNPILENRQEEWSYHGYATTDYYRVDPRFGTNAEYRELSDKAAEKGIKMVMDMIMNHCGSGHWWMDDLPSEDWINNPGNFFQTNHRRTTLRDPYASDFDREHFSDGWFVPSMPDLNQRNPLMATYLIQNTLWWIEFVNLAGIRMDTYPYSDPKFMTDWTCAILDEYPDFNICGEEWSLNPAVLAYWQMGKGNPDGYTSCLPGLLDFPMQNALKSALVEEEKWNSGMIKLYEMLSNDFQYADPYKHVIFPDNHDMSRILTQLNDDVDLLRLAMVYFATMRGTPQFYYGTEILMTNTGDDSHGNIRSDYPGGWEGDAVNAFTDQGLNADQIETRNFTKRLLNWRKGATAIHQGKLKHFMPADGVYTYFRYDERQKVMIMLNKSTEERTVELATFSEILDDGSKGKDVLSGSQYDLKGQLTIGAKKALVLEIN